MAAAPLAKATAPTPPSMALTRAAKTSQVGLLIRE